jgi:NTE family protein
MDWTSDIINSADGPADMRRRLGAAFRDRSADSDMSGQWRAVVAARLRGSDWPKRRVLIVAVDADTGEPVVFDDGSGVDLVDAVAASTSNGWTYAIGDRRYFNGGYRRNENADLAAGYDRVLVLSPFSGRSRHPLEWRMQLSAQVEELRAGGSTVRTVFPAGDSEHLFGASAMDVSMRPQAARAGHDQGRALAEELKAFWR